MASQAPAGAQLEIPPDLALQIQRVLQPQDAQLSPSWSESQPVEQRIDALLSHHQPLTALAVDRIHAKLRHDVQQCQATIDLLTAQLEHETDQARMSRVQEAIGALLEQLNLIREKARESENVVKEITRDIRSLDIAKRNIVSSMTALKRLQMLVNGVDQLERLAETRRYREAASALQAVKSLLDFFQSYRAVERIATAWKQVNELQTQLRTAVMNQYEQFFLHDPGRPIRGTSLPDAALVLDAIGSDARSSLIDWYCSLQLKEYRRIFRATDEAGQLDNVSRRYAWFRRILKTHEDEHAAAFVPEWHVERWMVRRFAEITKDDLKSVLVREQGRLNVATLLEALNSTLEFEAAMSRKYNMPFDEIIAEGNRPRASLSEQRGPSAITSGSQSSKPQTPQQTQQLVNMSSVFDPYLTVFVEAQDKTLAEMFVAYRRRGATLPSQDGGAQGGPGGGFEADGVFGESNGGSGGAGSGAVLPSSTEMFYFYRQTLEQCSRLSNREPFRELCNVYKKWLRTYADDVMRTALIRNEPVRKSIDVRPSISDLQRWCLVLNTADYCASTCSQLEDKLREKIHADFKDGVSLEEEREHFLTIISYAVQTLAREFEVCSEGVWNQMLRPSAPWSQLRQITGKSSYVVELESVLEQVGVVIRQETENKRYVRSWCDKVVAVVVARFTHTLVRLKPMPCIVAEQLFLDIREIKNLLVELPREENASFTRYAGTQVSRVETLLRVLMADDDDLVRTYVELVRDRSFGNLQKVLDLKGVRRVDQNPMSDLFLQLTSAQPDLPDQSFLTHLDMDPPPTPVVASPFLDGTSTPPTLRGASVSQANPESGPGRAFSDLRRFGSMFGAALGSRPR